ncbi:hypothetical protein MMC10_002422 [Thelotrema lepadinum]|nr:hypothetical protein [Thelotrema lepadinum]
MQGFFGKPVDNLHAEPLIARWIRHNVKNWQEAVVVSKNPGGSKRVTSLADALKLNFGIITTDRRRHPLSSNELLESSTILKTLMGIDGTLEDEGSSNGSPLALRPREYPFAGSNGVQPSGVSTQHNDPANAISGPTSSPLAPQRDAENARTSSPHQFSALDSGSPLPRRLHRIQTAPSPLRALRALDAEVEEEFTDERAREVNTGRLVRGHIVDDDFPSPMLSTMSGSVANLAEEPLGPSHFDDQRDPMTASLMSTVSSQQPDNAISGTYDQATLSDEEEEDKLRDPGLEHTVTLVGNVKKKTVLIIDDIMDRSESWIAAAETVVKVGGATKVYCIATHGVFGDNALAELEQCDCIDSIVVCDTFPIEPREANSAKKLVVLSMAGMLAEAIRRNQHGESISQIYQYYMD